MTNQTALRKIVNSCLREATKRVSSAKKGVLYRGSVSLADKLKKIGVLTQTPQYEEAREAIFRKINAELYDRIMAVDAAVEDGLDEILETVSDSLLDEASIFLRSNECKVERDEFIENFRIGSSRKNKPSNAEDIIYKHTLPYIRALAFLEIVEANPELVESLQINSSYFPNDLFRVKPKKNEVPKEIAHAIMDEIDVDLADIISKIKDFVIAPYGPGKYCLHKMGKYSLPANGGYVFTRKENSETESELDEIYNNPRIKSAVYNALWNCFQISFQTTKDNGEMGKGAGPFEIKKFHYANGIGAIKNFATNQLMYMWKELGKTGQLKSRLSRRMGMRAVATETHLIINYSSSRTVLDKQSQFRNSTKMLPYCVFLLNRMYKSAREIKK